jgi:hypothetical protein
MVLSCSAVRQQTRARHLHETDRVEGVLIPRIIAYRFHRSDTIPWYPVPPTEPLGRRLGNGRNGAL